jgi:hypothetical protein
VVVAGHHVGPAVAAALVEERPFDDLDESAEVLGDPLEHRRVPADARLVPDNAQLDWHEGVPALDRSGHSGAFLHLIAV